MSDQNNYYLNFDISLIKNMSHDEYIYFYHELIKLVKYHNDLYYNKSLPQITDSEYDKLFDMLVFCETNFHEDISQDSPTQNLSDQLDIQTEFVKADHDTPLLSLQKAYSREDLLDRDESNQKNLLKMWESDNTTYIIEPKYDWISVELIYIDGILTQAITRWDGIVGEDITANVKTIKNIPKILNGDQKGKMRFRWEILMTKSEFEKINEERAKVGEQLFANPRNAASGTAKQLDPNVTAKRNLICFVYEEL